MWYATHHIVNLGVQRWNFHSYPVVRSQMYAAFLLLILGRWFQCYYFNLRRRRNSKYQNPFKATYLLILGRLIVFEVFRSLSQRENGTMAKDRSWGRKLVLQKIQPFTCCCVRRACFSVTRRKVLEFAFGRLGVTKAHASWLAQLEGRVLIGAGGT